MNGQQMPNMTVIKGVLALMCGIMFVIFAYPIIVRMILFTVGILLIYYAIQMLNIPLLNQIVRTIKGYIDQFFS